MQLLFIIFNIVFNLVFDGAEGHDCEQQHAAPGSSIRAATCIEYPCQSGAFAIKVGDERYR